MLNKRASLGLRVITTIASASGHRTVTAESLVSVTGVSLSFIEGVLKDARDFGLIQSNRGHGGGYQPVASIGKLSIWDVVECFKLPDKPSKKAYSTAEWRSTNLLAAQAFQFEKEFLQKMPASLLAPEWFESDALKQNKSVTKHLETHPQKVKSVTPNSVFDLSNFLNFKAE
jgi:DNA-binding IscR family transcriptional regulator